MAQGRVPSPNALFLMCYHPQFFSTIYSENLCVAIIINVSTSCYNCYKYLLQKKQSFQKLHVNVYFNK